MSNEIKSEVEVIKEDADVRRALKQASSAKVSEAPVAEMRDKLLIGTHAFLFGSR